MSNVFEFVAVKREQSGRSAARLVRRSGQVPAIIYGLGEPQSIVLDHNEVGKHLVNEAVYSHILDLIVDGKAEKVVLKAVQRHPAKSQILHLDFLRVDMNAELKVHVPLHFMNEDVCTGVKLGGVITHAMVDVEILCLPTLLPEFIEVDLAELGISEAIHLSDLILPKGASIPALSQEGDHNHTVAQVVKTRGGDEDDVSSEEGSEEGSEEES